MAKDNKFNLDGFEQLPDGTYRKKKTVLQPREYKNHGEVLRGTEKIDEYKSTGMFPLDTSINESIFRTIKLQLFGIPMPKQSVRSTKIGHHYQPQDTVDRKKDYKRQIREQLPKGFTPFEHEVHITKFHCVYPPLKAFHKIKGRMEAIRNGEIFYKATKPDLPDNLKKLALDSMSDIVFKDDSLIVTENDTAKYYGIGGCIIIEMKGY